jgi:FkbM family methyltransferase
MFGKKIIKIIKNLALIITSKILVYCYKRYTIVKRNNFNYFLDLSERIDLKIFFFGNSEPALKKTKKIFKDKKRIVIIDCGANNGGTSMFLSYLWPKGVIHSIEANYNNFLKIKKNISLNARLNKKIIPYNFFITNKKNPRKIFSSWKIDFISKKNKYHSGIKIINNAPKKKIDYFLSLKKKIHFIKIDTDGYELAILKSAKKLIKKYQPVIFIELFKYRNSYNFKLKDLISYIDSINYDFYDINLIKILSINDYIKYNMNHYESKNIFLQKKV